MQIGGLGRQTLIGGQDRGQEAQRPNVLIYIIIYNLCNMIGILSQTNSARLH